MNRVVPGVGLAAGWLLLLFLGSWHLFALVAIGGGCLALHEFFRMTGDNPRGWHLVLIIACCLPPVLAACSGRSDFVLGGLLGALLLLTGMALLAYGVLESVFFTLCTAAFATLYISCNLAHLILLRFDPQGPFWLTMLVAIVAGSDTGAYYIGRAFGRRKLFPLISPKKTVAGGVGGLVAGVVTAEGFNLMFHSPADPWVLGGVAIVLVLIGIAGDLIESMIKRSVGVKDSGTILFGHGGLLDRIDSLLLTGPVLYYLLRVGLLP